ncbi:hypothetical protein FLK61_28205 [Paenalkalicoccus suaedae]|uniref:Uncharacterized protein n=2 Tax=Paenalkalicoccus suaedae TaxID=2592382 RepID=A0A859FCG6_9BACI|nr:hypothetical protein FLK61_28205 [Paenalkalicoccus suaedae]
MSALLLSCSQNQADESINGRYLTGSEHTDMFLLFVSDNYSGTSVRELSGHNDLLPTPYEREAYRIAVTNETTFSLVENTEVLAYEDISLFPNQPIQVTVMEDVEQFISSVENEGEVTEKLLPIYTASHVKVGSYTEEHLIETYTPVLEDHYVVQIFDGDFNLTYFSLLMEYFTQLEDRYDIRVIVELRNGAGYGRFREVTPEFDYLFLSNDGVEFKGDDYEELQLVVEEETGFAMPREGDDAWYQLLFYD